MCNQVIPLLIKQNSYSNLFGIFLLGFNQYEVIFFPTWYLQFVAIVHLKHVIFIQIFF